MLDNEYDSSISNYYESNIYSFSKDICSFENRNDIVTIYTSFQIHLDKHFKIYKSKEVSNMMKDIDTKDDNKLDSFLQKLLYKYKGTCLLILQRGRSQKAEKAFY